MQPVTTEVSLHQDVIEPWQRLCIEAEKAGFELTLASGYRSFERQLWIWNRKYMGFRPVMDDAGCPLDLSQASPIEKIRRILRWSALPGASRHHWGTDMDIYDRAAVQEDYQLQLLPAEYSRGGPFAPMIEWLEGYIRQTKCGFFFPYTQDRGGVMPEPWHLSYRPVAKPLQQGWSLAALTEKLQRSNIADKQVVLDHLDALYHDFIRLTINPALGNATKKQSQ